MTYRDIVHRLGITEDSPEFDHVLFTVGEFFRFGEGSRALSFPDAEVADDFGMSDLEEFVAVHADA
jgi:hypothetical protein